MYIFNLVLEPSLVVTNLDGLVALVTISAEEFNWLKSNISALQAQHFNAETNPFDSGDTAWLLTSSAFGNGLPCAGLGLA